MESSMNFNTNMLNIRTDEEAIHLTYGNDKLRLKIAYSDVIKITEFIIGKLKEKGIM